jgi:hypothetical protein
MNPAAAIYQVCAFRLVGRPELGGRKKDEGGALNLAAEETT